MLEKKNINSFQVREPYAIEELENFAASGEFLSTDFKVASAEIISNTDTENAGGSDDFMASNKELENQLKQSLLGENTNNYQINFIKTELLEVKEDMAFFRSKYSIKKITNKFYSY